eukprot:6480778-Amphidinium_carterae.1
MHASAKVVQKFHAEAGLRRLQSHAFCHMLRQLLPTPSAEEKLYQKLRDKFLGMLNKRDSNIVGRHVFLQEKMQHRKEQNLARVARGKSKYSHLEVMRLHGGYWNEATAKRKADCEAKARELRSCKHLQHREATARTEAQLAEAWHTLQQQHASQSTTLTFRSAKLPVSVWDMMQRKAYDISELSGRDFNRVVDIGASKQNLATSVYAQSVSASLLAHESQHFAGHPFIKTIAARRDDFKNAVFGLGLPEKRVWCKMCLAFQRPIKVMLLPLQQLQVEMPEIDLSKLTLKDVPRIPHVPHMRWMYDPLEILDDSHFSAEDLTRAVVFMSTEHVGECKIETYDFYSSLDEVVSWYPNKDTTRPRPETRRTVKKKTDATPDLLAAHPWLANYLRDESVVSEVHVPPQDHGNHAESENEHVSEHEGADHEITSTLEGVVQTFAEFDHQRAEQEEFALQD